MCRIDRKLVSMDLLSSTAGIQVPVGAAVFNLSRKERPFLQLDGKMFSMHQMGRRRWDVMTAAWRASIDVDPATDSLVLEFHDQRPELHTAADYVAQETLTVTGTDQYDDELVEKYYASLVDLTGIKLTNKKVLLL